MTRHLAVDLGAESGRCIMASLENGRIELEELSRFKTQGLRIGQSVRWNVYRFYEEIIEALRICVKKYGPVLDSIGVDTWGCDYVLLNKRGWPQALPYCYRDNRTKDTMALLEPVKSWIYERTGVQFLVFSTLNQLLAEKDRPGNPLEDSSLLFIGDYLHYLLGAEKINEYTVASISQLVETSQKQWDEELIGYFRFPGHLFQKIVHPGTQIGLVSDEILKETGLASPVRIITPAVHDTASAILSAPAEGDHWGYISSGTWSLVGLELQSINSSDEAFRINASNSGGAMGRNLFLKNVMGLWLIQQCRKQWQQAGIDLDYSDIQKKAEASGRFMGLIDPDNQAFFSPRDMIAEIQGFLGKTGQNCTDEHDVGGIARIIFESLALKYRHVFEQLRKATGKKMEVVHIIGGGSQNEILNQMVADATNLPVISGPAEATAYGNVLMQAYGCGQVSTLGEMRKIVANSTETKTYAPRHPAEWETAYRDFLSIVGL